MTLHAGSHVAVEREHPRAHLLGEVEGAGDTAGDLAEQGSTALEVLEGQHAQAAAVGLRDGVEQADPDRRPELQAIDDQPHLLLSGQGRQGPVEAQLLAIGQDPEHGDGVGMLSCIDPTMTGDISGKAVWTYDEVGRSISTPAVADGMVIAAEYDGDLHCVDAKTGKLLVVDEDYRSYGMTGEIAAIVAEYFGGPQDRLGPVITQNASFARYDVAWAAIVVASVVGLVLFGLALAVERVAMPWRRPS